MIFETHEPKPPFDGLVESIFHFRNFEPDHSIERVVPTGHVFVIFELDGMERQTFDNETLKPIASFRKALYGSGAAFASEDGTDATGVYYSPKGSATMSGIVTQSRIREAGCIGIVFCPHPPFDRTISA